MQDLTGEEIIQHAMEQALQEMADNPEIPKFVKDMILQVDMSTLIDNVMNRTSLSEAMLTMITMLMALDVESFILGLSVGMEVSQNEKDGDGPSAPQAS